jgi:hypothetical protein
MEAQIVRGLGHKGVERGIAGQPEDVVGIVAFRPFHGPDAAVVAVAAPDNACPAPMPPRTRRHMLDDRPHLRAFRGERRAQDRHHRRAAGHVIDVHRREAALVVMRVPERKLLTSMRRAERVVDVEDLLLARLHCRAGLINQSRGEPRRLRPARRVLQTTDRRGEASGEPVVGQRPTATFINGSCRSRSRSMASSWPHAIADTRAITISNIS